MQRDGQNLTALNKKKTTSIKIQLTPQRRHVDQRGNESAQKAWVQLRDASNYGAINARER